MEALVGAAVFGPPTAAGVAAAGSVSAATAAMGSAGLFGAAGAFGAGGLLTGGGGSLLQGLLTGASAFSQMQAGNLNASILNMQAQQSNLNARMETLKGRQQALTIRKQLDRDLASQTATFAARGSLAGEGSAAAAAKISRENAAEDINTAMFGARMGAESDKLQAAQFRAEGSAAKSAGRMEAINTITSYRPIQTLLDGI